MTGLTRARAIVAAAAAATAAVSAALLTNWPATPARADRPPPSLISGFMDHTSGDYLRVQLDSTAADYGQFVVALPGVGLVWPAGPATITVLSGQPDQLRYDGPGFLDANATLDTEFGVAYQPQGPAVGEPVRLVGQVDPANGTGSIEVWVAGTHYQFASLAVPHDADTAATQVLTDINASDWPALYSLADTSLRNEMTAQQFSQQASDGLGGGNIGDASQTGPISYSTSSAGVSYANVPASITFTHDGQTQTVSATVVLIRESGAWHWLTTSTGQ